MNLKNALMLGLVLTGTWITPVQACPTNVSDTLAYQRRDKDDEPSRCEGITRQGVSGSFGLVSFATSTLRRYPDELSLQIPQVGPSPNLRVRSFGRRYQLDSVELELSEDRYQIDLPTNILRNANVAAESLRAIAHLPGSQPVYVPVIIQSSASSYDLVFYSPSRTVIHSLEISRNNQVVHRDSRPNPRDGEIRFTWDAGNQPAGRYRLHVEAEIQQRGQRLQRVTRIFALHHNPDWLSR
jgi:flagellar basal-body rod modification protein FlgD